MGTVLLILLVTGMMFACVFAYYVKTCLTPNLDLSLEDFKLNESSSIWYQDSVGEWRELATLSGKENRIWVDYDQIPWYMEKALVSIEDQRLLSSTRALTGAVRPVRSSRITSPAARAATAARPSPGQTHNEPDR